MFTNNCEVLILQKVSPLSWPALSPSISILSLRIECCCYHKANQLSDHNAASFFINSDSTLLFKRNSSLLLSVCHFTGVQSLTNPLPRRARVVHPSSLDSLVDMGPKGLEKSLEGGPVRYVAAPTTHHQFKERRWAEWRGIKEDLTGTYMRVKEVRW